jgi:hypothetical protein
MKDFASFTRLGPYPCNHAEEPSESRQMRPEPTRGNLRSRMSTSGSVPARLNRTRWFGGPWRAMLGQGLPETTLLGAVK